MKPVLDARWASYFQASGDSLGNFLQDHFAACIPNKKVCLVLGRGFDPRMLGGLRVLCQILNPSKIEVISLVFDEGATSPSGATRNWYDKILLDWAKYSLLIRYAIGQLPCSLPKGVA